MKNESDVFLDFEKSVQAVYPDAEIYTFAQREGANKGNLEYNVLVLLKEVNSITYERVYDLACEVGIKHEMFLSPLLTRRDNRPLHLPHFF